MIMYSTGHYDKLIEEIEVTRSTKSSVWTQSPHRGEQRSARHGNYRQYWDTLEEAKQYIKEKCEREINRINHNLKTQKDKLEELKKY